MKSPAQLSEAQHALLRVLLYYDVFNYPLTEAELSNILASQVDYHQEVNQLIEQGIVFKIGDFYSLQDNLDLKTRREVGNQKAKEATPKARRRAKLAFGFPFVRGVYISGSMSKGVMTEDGDVDYFVITKPGRLWLTRSLLILYKKVFLLNSRRFFCMNYFIDSDHLEIEEQNLFTATELVTLLPQYHNDVHEDFRQKNSWITKYYPNVPMLDSGTVVRSTPIVKRLGEFLLGGRLGSQLDAFFMRLTMNVWKSKFGSVQSEEFEVAMKSRTYVSKHHPQNFQKKVLDAIEEKKQQLLEHHNIALAE